jgi:hypothetical protein
MQHQEIKSPKITANELIVSMLRNINADKKDVFYAQVEAYLNTLARGGSYYYIIKRLLKRKTFKTNSIR